MNSNTPEALLNLINVSLVSDLLRRPKIQVKRVQNNSSPKNTPAARSSSFQSYA